MSAQRPLSAKRFVFVEESSSDGGAGCLEVSIPEVLDPEYGMYIWPCAVVLAQYMWFYRSTVRGKTILEIGAGASLPGIVAAKCGAKVILSDGAELQNCLDNCRRSCQINNLEDVPVIGLTWGQISPDLVLLPKIDIILGSDVFYEPEDFEDIVTTIFYLMQKNPHALFWTTYQERSTRRGTDTTHSFLDQHTILN
ncbi:methyltransferase-like protein 23 isoform X3 [Heptranchias perlo]|uniref:methyltransferase-like protein 23 isoform X3 n=1 Tax=Heptranchias perlo TaxID=212740 RepID=UPI003559F0A2